MSVVPFGRSSWDRPSARSVESYDPFASRSPFESYDKFSPRPANSRSRIFDNALNNFDMDDTDSFLSSGFRTSRNMFGQMDRMMGSMMGSPFGHDPFFQESPLNALMGVTRQPPQRAEMRDPFALMPFGGMNNMMMSAMGNMAREGSCHSYSSSSVMTMTTGPDGRPQATVMKSTDANSSHWRETQSRGLQVYQASSSTRAAPGGVRETKKSVSDSRTGVRKMAIGHHINDRSHVIEKESKDGELEERQEFINLDEAEAPEFDTEYRRLAQNAYGPGALEHRPRHHRASPTGHRSTYLQALPSSASYRRRSRPMLALTSGTRCTVEEVSEPEDEVIISDDEKPKAAKNVKPKQPNLKNKDSRKSKKRKGPLESDFNDQEECLFDEEVLYIEEEKGISTKKKRKSSK